METVKTRLVDSGKGLVDGVRYVVSKHGISGLYKGLFPTMSKSCSNQALRFAIFNEYKRLVIGNRPTHELSAGEALIGGMTAGCLGAIGNTPFDTVKTRMQGLEANRYSSMLNCAVTMVKHFFSLTHSYIENVIEQQIPKQNTGTYGGCVLSLEGSCCTLCSSGSWAGYYFLQLRVHQHLAYG